MKKTFLLLTALVMLLGTVTGCAAQPSAAAEPAAPAAATESVAAPEATEVPAPKWPTEPVTIICPSKAGGFADAHSRVLADYLQRTTGVAFAVLNVTDGGVTVGSEQVRTAKPDGTTLLHFHTSFPISCYTGMYKADPEVDFTTIAAVENGGSNVFVCNADAPWNTLADLVNDAKSRPGEIIWGAAAGVTSQFMMAMLEKDAGVKFKMVDAGSEAEKTTALLGGHIQVTNIGIASADQYVKAGDLKILAVVGDERDATYPDYPTAVEQGFNVSWVGEFGLWGPAGMDPALVAVINKTLEGFATDQASIDALTKLGSWYEYRNVDESVARLGEMNKTIKDLAKDLGF